MSLITRRTLIAGGSAALTTLTAACDPLPGSAGEKARQVLRFGEFLSMRAHRLLLAGQPLVREFSEADISADFPVNGTERPGGAAYFRHVMSNFADFRLTVDGLVNKPLALTLDDIKAMPSRTQITMHNCDEGWSAIAKWTGVPLGALLQAAELMPDARYIVFHCLDQVVSGAPGRGGFYYESIDLFDALHPQTILAYGMNGKGLPVVHGAPLRLRVERQIGYKNAKYIHRVEAVEHLGGIAGGHGGFWEDRGYQWYAGL
ncbi:MAG: molybdopterin-dependent oxidoreductase [Bradyrhizobiaceae bacterium]|nr:molybdopterin-dependent oxidoreductase [Bradyrhizobiaceae bacterium]